MSSPLAARLLTPRLELLPSGPDLAGAALDFRQRHHAHLAPWDPPLPPAVFTLAHHAQAMARDVEAASAGRAARWWLRRRPAPGAQPAPLEPHRADAVPPLLGHLHFSQIARGPFHSAMLGFALATDAQGQGLMHEALTAAIAHMFGPQVRLHRIQANARPENTRSLRLLQRLGFEREGLAREYLYIDGAWRDHVLTARRNPDFGGAAPD